MGKKDIGLKTYLQDTARYADLWNGGVFAFKLQYVLDKAYKTVDFLDYQDLYAKYEQLPKTSFDYAVTERETNIQVLRFAGEWKDIGTWNTITEAMDEHSLGDVLLHESCKNVHILNELNVPVLAVGLHDVVISASPQGILVSDKGQSSYIKPLVDGLEQQVMFAEKSWGSYQVLDVEDGSLTIKVTLKPGHSMNYHCHQFRDEVWVVVAGKGRVTLDGVERIIKASDIVSMKAGCAHTVLALSELKMVEVQVGEEISREDKTVFQL